MIREFYRLISDWVSLNLTKGHLVLFVWGGGGCISALCIFSLSAVKPCSSALSHQGFICFLVLFFSSFASSNFFQSHTLLLFSQSEPKWVRGGMSCLLPLLFSWRKSPLLCVVSFELDRQLLASKISFCHYQTHICSSRFVTGARQGRRFGVSRLTTGKHLHPQIKLIIE